ncbi:hypothetical protein ABZ234_31885 [Nocardiopsis sp. NPDC006198]|uniref:hypothetical protein n=1 Tax=Nocardiopsis sp. NPDC006198 TaxID=3154472 RepID=UPI0033ABF608
MKRPDRCWTLQHANGRHHLYLGVVRHWPSRDQAADYGRHWATDTSPAQLPYRCVLIACACDAHDVLDGGCHNPDHDEDGCVSLAHGRDEDEARQRALANHWEDVTGSGTGLVCVDCL